MEKKQKFDPYDTRVYRAFTLRQVVTRPGAMTVLAAPSRMGSILYYPDGRVVK